MRSPFSPVDQATGLHAVIGILALLHERERTGEGGVVEASLFDSATVFLGYFLQGYWERGTEPERPAPATNRCARTRRSTRPTSR